MQLYGYGESVYINPKEVLAFKNIPGTIKKFKKFYKSFKAKLIHLRELMNILKENYSYLENEQYEKMGGQINLIKQTKIELIKTIEILERNKNMIGIYIKDISNLTGEPKTDLIESLKLDIEIIETDVGDALKLINKIGKDPRLN